MPFVTEELWQSLKKCLPSDWQATESIIISAYPEADEKAIDLQAERVMESIIEIIHSIRNVRVQYKVESARWIEAQVYAGELTPAITPYSQTIQNLARVRPVTFLDNREGTRVGENIVALVLKESEVIIPMESMVDLKSERKRLEKEIEQSQAEVAAHEARLKDRAFLSKAPAAVVGKERDKLAIKKDKLERLKQRLDRLY
jgi:valyl-tRNA synthetase